MRNSSMIDLIFSNKNENEEEIVAVNAIYAIA